MKIIIVPCVPKMVGRRYNIAHTLSSQGHEVHYLIWDLPYRMKFTDLSKHLFTSMFSKKYKYDNFTMHKIRRLPFFWPYINGLLFKYQIKKIYKQIDADIVFSQSYTNETKIPKTLPLIYDLNDDHAAMADVYGSPFYKLAFKLLAVRTVVRKQCENALAVTVVSDTLYKLAKQYNTNTIKLPNGVNKNVIEKVMNDRMTYPKNKYSIIYVTGFNQWSRPIETIKTVMDLRLKFPKIELTLVGEGTETKKIINFIDQNKIREYIHYLGGVYEPIKLFTLINQSSVGLNISEKNSFRNAAFPLKVLEYSAFGKKIVSTDLDEVTKLGFANIEVFKDGVRNGLQTALEKTLRSNKKYADVQNNVLKRYSWDVLTASLTKIIEDSLEGHNQ